MRVLPILLSDSYKQFHHLMYPKGITKLYSNMTPRGSRLRIKKAVWWGMQYYIKEYLIEQWNELFFKQPLEEVLNEYKRFHKHFSGTDVTTDHIEKLHNLGFLPLEIKALPEGTLVPMRVPFYTITNTHPDHAWLVNFLETQMSTVLWDLITVATISYEYRELLNRYALESTGSTAGVEWQGHDFSMRGRSSIESTFNQAGHLLSFRGTDTITAVQFLEEYYYANMELELIGASVPASEHSVMTSYGKEDELGAFKRLLDQFPKGFLSVVSDSFDLWKVCTEFLPELKDQLMARDGRLVIRPDSGDPVDIICGEGFQVDENWGGWKPGDYRAFQTEDAGLVRLETGPRAKGVIELLWETFGGTVNEKGYKVLDTHIGAIYGDSITLDRAEQICQRLMKKGFASTNVVLGIGSYTFNYNTRDTLGIAVKSTWCEVDGEEREIFKDPVTDSGLKKSAKGLLSVQRNAEGELILKDCVSHQEEQNSLLKTVFKDGNPTRSTTLTDLRKTLWP